MAKSVYLLRVAKALFEEGKHGQNLWFWQTLACEHESFVRDDALRDILPCWEMISLALFVFQNLDLINLESQYFSDTSEILMYLIVTEAYHMIPHL